MSFQSIVSQFFQWQTGLVVRWPLPFFVIPPLVAAAIITVTAMDFHLNTTNETLQVFLPDQMESLTDLKELIRLFPPKDPQRDTYSIFGSRFVYAVMERKEGGNMMDEEGVEELARLHKTIKEIKTSMGDTLPSVCLKEEGEGGGCTLHPLLYALEDESPFMSSQLLLRYPQLRFGEFVVDNVLVFGGVVTKNQTKVKDGNVAIERAAAVRLAYVLEESTESLRWMTSFLDTLSRYSPSNNSFAVYYSSSSSLAMEMERNGALLIPWMPWTALVLVLFCMLICSSTDPVRSQPWVGFFALLNASLATAAATSFLIYLRYPFLPLVFIMPFLVVSIGTDNMFLMLKSWRLTTSDNLEHRFTEALTETAASLFLTSLTDGLSFSIGSISDFYAVRVFCTYCAMAILFMFFFQISFFNAVMVLCCRREMAGRHSILCCRIATKREKTGRRPTDLVAFASRPLPPLPKRPLGYIVARFVQPWPVRLVVLGVYVVYLVVAIGYAVALPLGLDLKMLAPDGSYVAREMKMQERLFADYGPYCFVVLKTENLSMWNPEVRSQMTRFYEEMASSELASKGEFWLSDFEKAHHGEVMEHDGFMTAMHTFMAQPNNLKYRNDVRLSMDGEVEATKMMLRVRKLGAANDQPRADFLRQTMADSIFEGFVYDTSFLLVDQQMATVLNVFINVVTAIVTMLAICVLMVPRPVSALCIAASILSINIGVVGTLSAASTRLDIISMITIVMSIGFSVDYVTHTTFHFVIQRKDRLEKCLLVMTEPILQSALSTLVGVSLLTLVPSYIVRTFVYTVFFVVLIGVLHGLLFLPVLLATVVPDSEYLEPYHTHQMTNIPRPWGRIYETPISYIN